MGFINALSIPIMLLNMFGGIIAGVWLLFLGKWSPVGIAFAATFVSHFALGIVLMPGGLISAAAFSLLKKGNNFFGHLVLFVSSIYTFGLLWYWSLYVFGFFASYSGPTGSGFIPLMLLAYSVATGPIGYMASKEKDSPATALVSFCTMVGCMLFMLAVIFRVNPLTANYLFMGVMALGLFANLIMAVQVSTAVSISEGWNYED